MRLRLAKSEKTGPVYVKCSKHSIVGTGLFRIRLQLTAKETIVEYVSLPDRLILCKQVLMNGVAMMRHDSKKIAGVTDEESGGTLANLFLFRLLFPLFKNAALLSFNATLQINVSSIFIYFYQH